MLNVITRVLTAICGESEPTTRKPALQAKLSLCDLEGRVVPAGFTSREPAAAAVAHVSQAQDDNDLFSIKRDLIRQILKRNTLAGR